MVTHVAVCGDSFGTGVGIDDDRCYENTFAGQVASFYGVPLKVYARSGSCNFTIYLQIKKILEQMTMDPEFKPLILVTTAFHGRMIFPIYDDGFKNPDLSDVEYLSYHPYTIPSKQPEFPVNQPSRLISESIGGLLSGLHLSNTNISNPYRVVDLTEHLKAITVYYQYLYDDGVKHDYDLSLFTSMNHTLEARGVPHLFLHNFVTTGNVLFDGVNQRNFLDHSWGDYVNKYPDDKGTGHCSPTGNMEVCKKVINHISKHKLL